MNNNPVSQEAEKLQLETEAQAIREYQKHPVSLIVDEGNKAIEEGLVKRLIYDPIFSIESLVKHLEARGELRGIRRSRDVLEDTLKELTDKIKEIKL